MGVRGRRGLRLGRANREKNEGTISRVGFCEIKPEKENKFAQKPSLNRTAALMLSSCVEQFRNSDRFNEIQCYVLKPAHGVKKLLLKRVFETQE